MIHQRLDYCQDNFLHVPFGLHVSEPKAGKTRDEASRPLRSSGLFGLHPMACRFDVAWRKGYNCPNSYLLFSFHQRQAEAVGRTELASVWWLVPPLGIVPCTNPTFVPSLTFSPLLFLFKEF